MSYTDLGNTVGRIYAVLNGVIQVQAENTKEGLRMMKSLALQSRALGLGQRGFFTITISDITDAGNVTGVSVDTVAQIGPSIAYGVGEENQLAAAIAAAISSLTPAGGPNYVAKSVGPIVYGYAPVGADPSINGDVVAVSTTGDITIVVTPVENVPDQTEIYSTTHGYRFYLDASATASLYNYSAAEEVTNYIIPQTLDGQLPTKDATLANDIASFERVGAITTVFLTPQSGDDDDCIGFNPAGFADGDLVYVQAVDDDKEITFKESGIGNLQLKGGVDYVSSSNVGQAILFRHHEGVFYEVVRGGSDSAIYEAFSRSVALSRASAGTLVPGTRYLITDVGHRGVLLTAESVGKFSLAGTHFAAVPDWQNQSGDFVGVWNTGLSGAVGSIVVWGAGNQYINTTGVNGASNPSIDTTNWTLIDRATSLLYITEEQSVEYDILSNKWVEVKDKRGNTVVINPLGATYPDWFVWGSDKVYGNQWRQGGGNTSWRNNNTFMSYRGGNFYFNTMVSSGYALPINAFSNVYQNRALNSDIDVETGVEIGNGNVNRNVFENVELRVDVTGNVTIQESRFRHTAGNPMVLHSSILSSDVQANQSGIVHVLTDGFNNAGVLTPLGSTFEISRGLTGTGLDVGGGYGIITVESGSSEETIDEITGGGINKKMTIKPQSGLTLTIVGADPDSPGAGDVLIPPSFWDDISPSPSTFGEIVLDGSKGEYIEVSRNVNYIVEKVIKF